MQPSDTPRSRRASARRIAGLFLFVAAVALTPHGEAAAQPGSLNLIGQMTLPNSLVYNSDIWGWVDPVTSKEYVVVGEWTGSTVYIVEVTDPTNPTLAGVVNNVVGFDVKTYTKGDSTYLYLCNGGGFGNTSQVWNVTNPLAPYYRSNFPTCHNITIDDQGYMYLSYSTLRIYNLNPDPGNPTFVWSDNMSGGHDANVVGDRLYDFHGYQGTFIYDVSNRNSPQLLGTIPFMGSGLSYHHSGYPSPDGRFLYINDELGNAATADITCWDISNPAAPFKVAQVVDPDATSHNSYAVGNYLFVSHYVAGLRVYDIGSPWSFYLVDEYDTAPGYTGNNVYEGCWGVYTGSPSGVIFASDMQNGLYCFTFAPNFATGAPDDTPAATRALVLGQNVPNPFNPTTTIAYELPSEGRVRLTVFDAGGAAVRTLVDGVKSAGPHTAHWNGENASGQRVASGVYFYRIDAGGATQTKRMILLK